MIVKFEELKITGFKSHQDLTVNFGERTEITGDNAAGKSSIGEALTWLLYAVDLMGSTKFDPTPINYEADITEVSLLLEIDNKKLLLGKTLKKGKAAYYVNEVPSKANEYKEIVEKLFDKELFLSLFNPLYFPSLKWEKQREMIMQYVSAPANKEVLKALLEPQSEVLAPLLKKNNLPDIEKIYRDKKVKLEKQHIAAESKTKTLKEQIDQFPSKAVALESIKVEISTINKQIKEIEKVTDSAGDNNRKIINLQNKISNLAKERDEMKEEFKVLKEEKIESACKVCKQPLEEQSIKAVQEDKDARIQNFKSMYNHVVQQRKDLEAQLSTLEYIDVSEQIEKIRNLDEQLRPLHEEIRNHEMYNQLNEQVQDAAEQESQILKELNNSIFTVDSVKAFKQKEAELQAEKVQALFTTLTIKLSEIQKNGEPKNTFEIELDDKPFRKLSLSESIRAGLELRDVLSQQSGVVAPCFIDNSESITKFKAPVGQLITSRVVAGQELKIEGGNK